MANHMCPQDYVNLTRQFLTCNCRSLLPFTVDTVTKYCIKKTPELDPGDETIIRQIVTETLEMYRGKGCLKKLRNTYHVLIFSNTRISNVEGFVLEDPRPMGSISSEMIEKLNCIDQRTRYGNDPTYGFVNNSTPAQAETETQMEKQ